MWKKIKGYSDYEVSDEGQIRSLKNDRIRILKTGSSGEYLMVNLCVNNKSKSTLVHKLVVEAFIKEIPNGKVINHKDNNPKNNRLNNLEIVTHKQNSNMAVNNSGGSKELSKVRGEIGDLFKNRWTQKEIAENYGCRADSIRYQLKKAGITKKDIIDPDINYKISDKDADAIRKSYKRGIDLAKEFGVNPSYISKIKNNKR